MTADLSDTYTWQEAARDIALSTPLNVGQATLLCHHLAELLPGRPYDLVPLIVELENADGVDDAIRRLVALIAAARRVGPGPDRNRLWRMVNHWTARAEDCTNEPGWSGYAEAAKNLAEVLRSTKA